MRVKSVAVIQTHYDRLLFMSVRHSHITVVSSRRYVRQFPLFQRIAALHCADPSAVEKGHTCGAVVRRAQRENNLPVDASPCALSEASIALVNLLY